MCCCVWLVTMSTRRTARQRRSWVIRQNHLDENSNDMLKEQVRESFDTKYRPTVVPHGM